MNLIENPTDVISCFEATDTNLFDNWDVHPLSGNFGRALHSAINDERGDYKLCYFVICDGTETLVMVPATCDGSEVTTFGTPLALGLRRHLSKKRQRKALSATFDHLRTIAKNHGAKTIRILGNNNGFSLGNIDNACIEWGARPKTHIHGIIDLTLESKSIRTNLRSSFRSLINWGERNIRTIYINAENPDRSRFEEYPSLHAKVSGRTVYDNQYWEVLWNEVTSGRGELSIGYLEDGTVATGTVVIDANKTAYYTSGAYDRELFDKPLGHFAVYNSILRASARSMKIYDLGEIFPKGSATEKQVKIGFFKKGFTSTFFLRTVWEINLC
ncbi:MAG: hypothetical protein CMF69_10220 [Magnetovibrio sp.]|nr:hypothetical protein [Magnetovibrio sp.]|tara:strand:+ start:1955 stop:2941 length:987 start_codon:yes stop_codon:yes gene_type:complete